MAILLFLLRLIGWVLLAVLLLLLVALLIPLGVRFAYRPGSVRATVLLRTAALHALAAQGPAGSTEKARLRRTARADPCAKRQDGEQASVTVEFKPDKPAAKPAQTVARQPAAQGKPEAPKPADSVPH